MEPGLAELLASIRWSFEEKVAPHVTGELAQSYARSLAVLLGIAEARVSELVARSEEVNDLRRTLEALVPTLPGALAAEVSTALAATSDLPVPDPAAITDAATMLRKLLVRCMREAGAGSAAPARAYLARQTRREAALNPAALARGF
jgi:hypothetical protein